MGVGGARLSGGLVLAYVPPPTGITRARTRHAVVATSRLASSKKKCKKIQILHYIKFCGIRMNINMVFSSP